MYWYVHYMCSKQFPITDMACAGHIQGPANFLISNSKFNDEHLNMIKLNCLFYYTNMQKHAL